MRIHKPVIERSEGNIRLSARVETEGAAGLFPDTLWFEVPEKFESMIYTGIESFVVALLPYAMRLGEDVHCDGLLSQRLAYHIRLAGQVFFTMEPELVKPVAIHPAGLRSDPPSRPAGVGLMFSGGVDSFYALMRHRPGVQAVPDYTLTHGVFLYQFELYNQENSSYQNALSIFNDLFQRLGLTLIPATFNLREFRLPSDTAIGRRWHLRTHQYELAAAGLFLSGGLGRMLISSDQLFNAYGSDFGGDFETETLLSTEWHEIVHDGLADDRTVKTIAISEWPETYHTLRVCWWKADGVQNCGQCPKCVRTTTTLAAIGRFDRYSTFPKPYRPQVILKYMTTIRGSYFLPGIRDMARANGRTDIAFRISVAIVIVRLRVWIKWLVTRFNPGFKGF